MDHCPKNIRVMPNPDGKGYHVSYEIGSSRKVHPFKEKSLADEISPHGAGSFHDPNQHRILMDRLDQYIKNTAV